MTIKYNSEGKICGWEFVLRNRDPARKDDFLTISTTLPPEVHTFFRDAVEEADRMIEIANRIEQ